MAPRPTPGGAGRPDRHDGSGGRPRPGPGDGLGAGAGEFDRAIRTARLHVSPRFHLRPIDVVVFHGSRRDLVLREASRLDAFSGYPVRT